MRRTVERLAVFALGATLSLLAGCSDASSPTEATPASTFFSRAPEPGFDVMRRRVPLATSLSATRTIGAEGGTIDLWQAGVSLVIPAGALGEDTAITLRALPGDAVAFEFAPHGLEFRLPASIHVRAEGTEAERLLERGSAPVGAPLTGFRGVYFDGDPEVGTTPLEVIDTYLSERSLVFQIHHFSGYACASG